MMKESMYQEWLNVEREWIGEYCNDIRKKSLLKVVPLTLILFIVFFGGMAFLGSGNTEDLLVGAVGGLFFGFTICAVYLAILFINLNPNRYINKIEQSVSELIMDEVEKERLGEEMIEALNHESQVMNYQMVGPKSKGTPARVIKTPHYVFQEGSTPYAVLVRMSDIAEVRKNSENKMAVSRSANSKTYHHFTLYSIGFYRKDRFEKELADSQLPDYAFGFFQEELRDKAFEIVKDGD